MSSICGSWPSVILFMRHLFHLKARLLTPIDYLAHRWASLWLIYKQLSKDCCKVCCRHLIAGPILWYIRCSLAQQTHMQFSFIDSIGKLRANCCHDCTKLVFWGDVCTCTAWGSEGSLKLVAEYEEVKAFWNCPVPVSFLIKGTDSGWNCIWTAFT